MTEDLTALPTGVDPANRDGPTVDGAPLREGDVLAGPEGPLVVVGTRHGPANAGVALFDPDDHRRRVVGGDHRALDRPVRRRALGVARTVDDDRVTLCYASYDPETERFRCACGRAPLGAPVVPFEARTDAATRAGLREAVEPPLSPDSELSPVADGVDAAELARLADRVGSTAVAAGDEAGGPALSATDVPIPTAGADPLDVDVPLRPGDRLVSWPDRRPPADPLAADRATLSAGRCAVVLDGGTVYDLAGGGRESVDAGALCRRVERARERGVVLRLLARECHVDPIGEAHTDSLHVYAATVDGGRTALACGDRLATATPRLEHPLALRVETAPDPGGVAERLRTGGGPLAPWTDEEATAALCRRVADRAVETAANRPEV